MKRKIKEWVLNHKKQVICGFGIVALIMVFSAAFILQGSNNEAVAKADAGQRAAKDETDITVGKAEEKSEESIKEETVKKDKNSEKTKVDDTTAESKTAKKETKDGNSQSAIKPAASSNTGSSKETESKSSNTGATTPSSSSSGNNKSGTGTTSTESSRSWNSNTGTGNSNSGSSQNTGAGNKQSGTSSGSSGSSSSSSGNSNSNTGSAEKNTSKTPVWHEPVYEEKWVVDQAAWTEEVPHYEQVELCICNGCGADITDDPIGHMNATWDAGIYTCGGYHSEWKQVQTGIDYIQHEEVGHWERVLVQAGYWE